MTRRSITWLFGMVLLIAGLEIPGGKAQEVQRPVKAVQVTGLTGVKDNTKGTLSVENGKLHFIHGNTSSDVSATSVEDVVTGADSQESVGKTVGMMSMAAPYGSGRFLSLFRTKIDTLTIEYRDTQGGLHGTIFTMPAGSAEVIKKELVADGAHTTAMREPTAAAPSPYDKEQKQ